MSKEKREFLTNKFPLYFVFIFPMLEHYANLDKSIEYDKSYYEDAFAPFFEELQSLNISLDEIPVQVFTPYEKEFVFLFKKFAQKNHIK